MNNKIKFKFQDVQHEVHIEREGNTLILVKDGLSYHVELIPDITDTASKKSIPIIERKPIAHTKIAAPPAPAPPANGECTEVAPITGTVLAIKVVIGQQVQAGDLIAIVEAMKMEIDIFASVSGSVQSIMANPGDSVKEKQPLLNIA